MSTDIIGKALLDYYHGNYSEDIRTYSSFEEEDVIPLPYFFRDFEEMPIIEQQALELCNGRVLDIGCGAGSHSLYLQQKNIEVIGLDSSFGAIATCKARGLKKTIAGKIEAHTNETYDTLLLLMNGIGLAGTLNNLDSFLAHLKSLLTPHGQILLDSSDVIYMFEKDKDGSYRVPASENYYGEASFTMAYQEKLSPPFPWLYIDFNKLSRAAQFHNLSCELLCEGEHYDYLARLSPLTQ